ncbi:DUF317 domain-containing protein [Streptomyces griseus]|uniref:DUF317 domain-containing protein n=1 Tax=Streptomyces griseus TaxID=1911 RepID=UPI00386744D2|nr:DUF317 domain-containing protein [Streptomyces fimicarius]
MIPTAPDALVRLDTHPTHCSAVVATVTGSEAHRAVAALEADGWHVVAESTLVLVRIDREEPYWAAKTAQVLTADSITVDISPRLQDAMAEEWTWAAYPMPWCTRDEIREVSDQAQQIHDALRHGHLRIHAHAHDGHTTVAVGTYTDGTSVHLHGEDHLRVVSLAYDGTEGEEEAIQEFRRLYGDSIRTGPAPLTHTEREAEQAREALPAPSTTTAPPEHVPVYLAGPADHEAVLGKFLTDNAAWTEHRRPGEDTYAAHESLVLGVELRHRPDAGPRDEIWTFAAYESPVGDRIWHATATAGTPEGIITVLLGAVADEHGWSTTVWAASTIAPDRKAVLPLADYSWIKATTEAGSVWTSPEGACRILHDRHSTWSAAGGENPQHPSWTVQFSQSTPPEIIQQLVFELAEGLGPRRHGRPRTPRASAPRPVPAIGPPATGAASPPTRR